MEVWTSMASLLGALAFFQAFLRTVFPPACLNAIVKLFQRLSGQYSANCYFDISETDGVSTNELYGAVKSYLSSAASDSAAHLSLSRPLNSSAFVFGLTNNGSVLDSFAGATAVWEHIVMPRSPASFSWRPLPDERRGFTLRIRKEDKPLILPGYLNHIMDVAADIRRRSQERLLYTNSRYSTLDSRNYPWESVPFKHPSTFDTLAMDPARKEDIMADLRSFAAGQSFYQKTGRAWKRGYLLFGPPGTGKSSMIAAMANFLGYDIYDLELTEVFSNSELRKLLMKTTSKSIIVIEDIDCSVSLSNRGSPAPPVSPPEDSPAGTISAVTAAAKSLTLSGLLNFTDGLWSCCGSERIFVFTTNHIEKLDSALLRSGRMDMHIYMSYCSFPALKILMRNYLDVDEAELDDGDEYVDLTGELRESVEAAEITPADVSEVLIKNKCYEKRRAMEELLRELKKRAALKSQATATAKEAAVPEVEEEEQEKRALENPKVDDGVDELGKRGKESGKEAEVEEEVMPEEVC